MKINNIFIQHFIQLVLFVSCIYSYPATRQSRDSIVLDYSNYNSFQPNGAGSYSFGYEIEDPEYRNIQYRDEERQPNGTVIGSYGWVKPDGNIITIKYIADEKGYRASVENSPGQLKFHGQPVPAFLKESLKPSEMLNPWKNLDLYKNKNIQEQHYRPIDQPHQYQQHPIKNINKVNNNLYDDFEKNQNDGKKLIDPYNIEPKRFFVYSDRYL